MIPLLDAGIANFKRKITQKQHENDGANSITTPGSCQTPWCRYFPRKDAILPSGRIASNRVLHKQSHCGNCRGQASLLRVETPAARVVTAGVNTFLTDVEAIGLTPLIAPARRREAITPRRSTHIIAQLVWSLKPALPPERFESQVQRMSLNQGTSGIPATTRRAARKWRPAIWKRPGAGCCPSFCSKNSRMASIEALRQMASMSAPTSPSL